VGGTYSVSQKVVMSKKAEDVIEEIFEAVGADDDARALKAPLHDLWKEDRWTAEQIARAAEEAHKPK
jgi:hypothetical protein